MGFYPLESFVIETKLQQDQIAKLISENIALKKNIFMSFGIHSSVKDFEGKVRINGFRINRIQRSRYDTIPLVIGTIKPTTQGCRIHIVIRFVISLYLFVAVWLTGALIGDISIFINSLHKWNSEAFLGTLMLTGIVTVPYLIMTFLFIRESAKSKIFLNDLFREH